MAPGITGQLVTAWIIILLQVSRRVMTRVASQQQQQRYTTADHSSCSNNQQQQHNNTTTHFPELCNAAPLRWIPQFLVPVSADSDSGDLLCLLFVTGLSWFIEKTKYNCLALNRTSPCRKGSDLWRRSGSPRLIWFIEIVLSTNKWCSLQGHGGSDEHKVTWQIHLSHSFLRPICWLLASQI